jgi:hypothetical protein
VCPTGAIEATKVSDAAMAHRASDEALAVLEPPSTPSFKPGLSTRPRVYYRNLYRHNQCFIGGAVSAVIAGRSECVEGVSVTLHHGGTMLAQASTDTFGEFRFDRLAPNSGEYAIDIAHPTHGKTTVRAALATDSLNLGELRLTL